MLKINLIKFLISCFFCLLFLVSPAANAAIETEFNQQNSALYAPVQEYITAWNQQDIPNLLSTFTPDGVYQEVLGGFSLENPVAASEFLRQLFASLPDGKFTSLDFTTDGKDIVAWHWRLTGTAEGKPVAFQGVDLIHLENGKIKSVRGFSSPD